ncbi:MAG: RNA polymerase sigma factor [Flavonifractor plautii]
MAHQAGGAAGLERLMEEYGTGLLRLCALQLGDAALAEDAAQETLLRAWRRYGTFRGRRQSAPGLQRLPSTCAGICSAPRGTPAGWSCPPWPS